MSVQVFFFNFWSLVVLLVGAFGGIVKVAGFL